MKKKRIKHGDLLLSVSGKSPQTYLKIIVLFFLILIFSIKGFSQDIHRAVSEGDIEKVEFLLKENPLLVNEEDSRGWTPIYSMQDRVKNLSFILNDAFEKNYSGLNLTHTHFPKPGQTLDVEGLEVSVIPSYQNKKGYFIECDGLSLFWFAGLSDDYISSKKDTKAVEFVLDNLPGVNLMFLGTPDGIGPEKGNGIREAYLESMGLNPDAVFFMGKEHLGRKILYQIERRIQNPENIYCAENPGDMFFYVQGEIKK